MSHAALLSLQQPQREGAKQMKHSILSCATAAALALTGAGIAPLAIGTAHANDTMSSSDQPVTDSWITTKVKGELATTDGVKSTDISVKTIDGVVTLTGVLSTPLAVKKAIAAAESIKGVKKVDHDGLKSR
jgi:hyperosmotically inducible protein